MRIQKNNISANQQSVKTQKQNFTAGSITCLVKCKNALFQDKK